MIQAYVTADGQAGQGFVAPLLGRASDEGLLGQVRITRSEPRYGMRSIDMTIEEDC